MADFSSLQQFCLALLLIFSAPDWCLLLVSFFLLPERVPLEVSPCLPGFSFCAWNSSLPHR
jgi:hypothetical protein